MEVTLSRSTLKESISKKASAKQIARLLPVLTPTAESAVLIERHLNRYYYDNDTVHFDNLLGAYIDGEDIVPVRFGLKYSVRGSTTLYVVVDQNKIPLSWLERIKRPKPCFNRNIASGNANC